MEKRILSVKDLCGYLGVGRNTAYSLVHMRGFPCIRIGNRILIPEFQLENWLADGAIAHDSVILRRAKSNEVKTKNALMEDRKMS